MSFINKRIQFIRPRKNGRVPGNYPQEGCGVPLRITRLFPMKLKDISVDKLKEGQMEIDNVCNQEMMALFDCFEKNDFNAVICKQQAVALAQCHGSFMKKKSELKAEKTARRKAYENK